jgi:hypothetical protein
VLWTWLVLCAVGPMCCWRCAGCRVQGWGERGGKRAWELGVFVGARVWGAGGQGAEGGDKGGTGVVCVCVNVWAGL